MIDPTVVQNEILTAQLKCADLSYANLVKLQGGALQVNWTTVRNGQRAINSVSRQLGLGDTDSSQFLKSWSCLNVFVGTYAGGNIDPHSQNPGIIVEVVVVSPSPVDPITWSEFDAATENPDGNRSFYFNSAWKGFNPVLSLTSPAETALRVGTDYTILAIGGIQLLNDLSGNGSPGVADGMTLRATSYQIA